MSSITLGPEVTNDRSQTVTSSDGGKTFIWDRHFHIGDSLMRQRTALLWVKVELYKQTSFWSVWPRKYLQLILLIPRLMRGSVMYDSIGYVLLPSIGPIQCRQCRHRSDFRLRLVRSARATVISTAPADRWEAWHWVRDDQYYPAGHRPPSMTTGGMGVWNRKKSGPLPNCISVNRSA